MSLSLRKGQLHSTRGSYIQPGSLFRRHYKAELPAQQRLVTGPLFQHRNLEELVLHKFF